jgi:hypothetical protein
MGECEPVGTKTKHEAWQRGERSLRYKGRDRQLQQHSYNVSPGKLKQCCIPSTKWVFVFLSNIHFGGGGGNLKTQLTKTTFYTLCK